MVSEKDNIQRDGEVTSSLEKEYRNAVSVNSRFMGDNCDSHDSKAYINSLNYASQLTDGNEFTSDIYNDQSSTFINNISALESTRYNNFDSFDNGVNGEGIKSSRRIRFKYTKEQISRFEEIFTHNMFPDSLAREEISKELNIPTKNIQVWFKNRRAKHRKFAQCCDKPSFLENSTTVQTPDVSVFRPQPINNGLPEGCMYPQMSNPMYMFGSYNMGGPNFWIPQNFAKPVNPNNASCARGGLPQTAENQANFYTYMPPGPTVGPHTYEKLNNMCMNNFPYAQILPNTRFHKNIPTAYQPANVDRYNKNFNPVNKSKSENMKENDLCSDSKSNIRRYHS